MKYQIGDLLLDGFFLCYFILNYREEPQLYMQPISLMGWRHGQHIWHTSKMVSLGGLRSCQRSMSWRIRPTCCLSWSPGSVLKLSAKRKNLFTLLPKSKRALLLVLLLLSHLDTWHTTVDFLNKLLKIKHKFRSSERNLFTDQPFLLYACSSCLSHGVIFLVMR